MPRAILICAAALLVSAGVTVTADPPQPSPTQIAWQLEFEHAAPKRIEVQLPGDDAPTVYWYLLYEVTNPSPRTQHFFPMFQLVTDDLSVVDTDKGISPLVFDAIKTRHQRTHPYLVHPTKAIGELLTGDDHARQSVAIWRADMTDANAFDIYIAGLSGETRAVANPDYDPTEPEVATLMTEGGQPIERTVNPPKFILRKTLQLGYRLPGSAKARGVVEPIQTRKIWILR